jgi:hypothetical protein
MAKLTYSKRKGLDTKDFAIPEQRKFPILDRAHAANAKSRAAQSGSPSIKSRVDAAVAAKYPDMGKSDGSNGKKST